jgi:hypothetical protein
MSVSYGNWGLSRADSAIKYCTVHEHVEKKISLLAVDTPCYGVAQQANAELP